MRIGFDLDGTLCSPFVVKTPGECRDAEYSGLEIPSDNHEVYLISARSETMRKDTEEWLAENEIEYDLLVLLDDERLDGLSHEDVDEKQALFKASKIGELELDAYVEDRPAVRERLRELRPACAILSPDEARMRWGPRA